MSTSSDVATRDRGSRERAMVPRARFRSYYGRAVLKPPVWEWKIPAYLFAGGLSAGSAVLAVGADLTGRPALRRVGRVGALAALAASTYFLIADLGRPERFHHMLRVAKPTSPMSVGTWILAAYGPGVGVAAAGELLPAALQGTVPGRLLRQLSRPAGLSAAVIAPGVASYTAVLLSQTAALRGMRCIPSCRSCSPAPPPRARAASGWCSRQSGRPAPLDGSRRWAQPPSSPLPA